MSEPNRLWMDEYENIFYSQDEVDRALNEEPDEDMRPEVSEFIGIETFTQAMQLLEKCELAFRSLTDIDDESDLTYHESEDEPCASQRSRIMLEVISQFKKSVSHD